MLLTMLGVRAYFICDLRDKGVPMIVGYYSCLDHWHIGVVEIDADGRLKPVDVHGGDEPEKFASVPDAVAALAQIIEDSHPGIVFEELDFEVSFDLLQPPPPREFSALIGDPNLDDMFYGAGDFNPPPRDKYVQ